MDVEHLVDMANEIAEFFGSESTPAEAPKDVAAHLRRNWEPRMRKALIAHWRAGATGLNTVAAAAVAVLNAAETSALKA